MEMTIIYIVLTVLLLGILWHIFYHLMVVFHEDTTDLCVNKVMEDPYKYVRDEEMCYVLRNFVYLFFAVMLLIAACKGNIHYGKQTMDVEVGLTKK